MSEQHSAPAPVRGARVRGSSDAGIGRVDAVFADYVLVRTRGLLPVDLYIPRPELLAGDADALRVDATPQEAYRRWHRPLHRSPHEP